jgi:NAD(P)-dependent dehydrogenase (short-subunit alcohol dehydrogenase family)
MRRILVTGANKGIGLAIVTRILAEHEDTQVLLGSRDATRGQSAIDGLCEEHPDWRDRLHLLQIDVSSDESVAKAAESVATKFGKSPAPLYGIVNNAGIGFGDSGLAGVLAVNSFGLRRVCEAFLPLLDAEKGRIANLTSAAGPNFVANCSVEMQGFFLDEDIQWNALESLMNDCIAIDGDADAFAAKGLSDGEPYGISKAFGNSYTLLLARENPSLCINACTPGFIETDLTRTYAEKQGKSPAEMGMKPPAEGATSALFLMFGSPEGSGHYYGSDAKRSPLDRYRAPGTPAYQGD